MMEFHNPRQAETLGGRITQARAFSRLTQDQLRRAVGCDRKTLSSWENDHTSPTVHQLLLIADLTGFPVTWFVEDIAPPSPHRNRRALAVTDRSSRAVTHRGIPGQVSFFDEPVEQPEPEPAPRPAAVSGRGQVTITRGAAKAA